jgi:hypothetical protein
MQSRPVTFIQYVQNNSWMVEFLFGRFMLNPNIIIPVNSIRLRKKCDDNDLPVPSFRFLVVFGTGFLINEQSHWKTVNTIEIFAVSWISSRLGR